MRGSGSAGPLHARKVPLGALHGVVGPGERLGTVAGEVVEEAVDDVLAHAANIGCRAILGWKTNGVRVNFRGGKIMGSESISTLKVDRKAAVVPAKLDSDPIIFGA